MATLKALVNWFLYWIWRARRPINIYEVQPPPLMTRQEFANRYNAYELQRLLGGHDAWDALGAPLNHYERKAKNAQFYDFEDEGDPQSVFVIHAARADDWVLVFYRRYLSFKWALTVEKGNGLSTVPVTRHPYKDMLQALANALKELPGNWAQLSFPVTYDCRTWLNSEAA